MLSSGQYTEGVHNLTFCVLQQLNPQACVSKRSIEGCHTLYPVPYYWLSTPFPMLIFTHHTRGSLIFFIFLLSLKYFSKLLLGEEEEQEWVAQLVQTFPGTGLCWGPHGPRPESELWYSRFWVLRVEGNGQGEAGLVMVNTEETRSIFRVIDQVIPVKEQWGKAISVAWAPKETWRLPKSMNRHLLGWPVLSQPSTTSGFWGTYWSRNWSTRLFMVSDPL